MSNAKILLAATTLALLSACASMPESTATKDARDGALYSEEEKAAMSPEEKVAAYNESQEEQNQVVCRRERPVGSRMTKTVCRTRAQIEQERRAAQDALSSDRGYTQGPGN
jgi:hypothetical protein